MKRKSSRNKNRNKNRKRNRKRNRKLINKDQRNFKLKYKKPIDRA